MYISSWKSPVKRLFCVFNMKILYQKMRENTNIEILKKYFFDFLIKAFKVFIQGFGDNPQQAKIDEIDQSGNEGYVNFSVSAYALTVLA